MEASGNIKTRKDIKITIFIVKKKNVFLKIGFSLKKSSKKENKNIKSPIPK